MYIPSPYKMPDVDHAKNLIKAYPFASLIRSTQKAPLAVHVPILFESYKEKEVLCTHVSNANPIIDSLEEGQEVLLIFQGPFAYISSSWYEKEEVPTWNYLAVHVYAKMYQQSQEELSESLSLLIDHFEQNRKNAVKMNELSKKTLKQIYGITGYRLEPTRYEGVQKLSQNRNDTDYAEIVKQLEQGTNNDIALAKEMKKLRSFD